MDLVRSDYHTISYLKRLTNAVLGWFQAFRTCMYGGIGMSASSLHRESTDSLIYEISKREVSLFQECLYSHRGDPLVFW